MSSQLEELSVLEKRLMDVAVADSVDLSEVVQIVESDRNPENVGDGIAVAINLVGDLVKRGWLDVYHSNPYSGEFARVPINDVVALLSSRTNWLPANAPRRLAVYGTSAARVAFYGEDKG